MKIINIKPIPFLFTILVMSICFLGCEKEDLRGPYVGLIDPETEPDRLGRHLGIQGSIEEGSLPMRSNNNLYITNAQSSAKVSKGSKLYVPFTFSAEQTISGVYLQVVGAKHYWKIPAENAPNEDSFVFSVDIPDRVLQGDFDIQFAFFDDAGNISAASQMTTTIANIEQACGGNGRYHEQGSKGLTVRRMELSDIAGTVEIEYYMYSLPDRLDIWYNGEWVATTDSELLHPDDPLPSSVCYDGTPGYVSGGNTLSFEYDPDISREFFIYMYGCFGQTAWDFWVDCPANQSLICRQEQPAASIFTANETLAFPLNSSSPQISSVSINKGDFIFVGAKGEGSIGSNMLGISVEVEPEGDLVVLGEDIKIWPKYNPGQLIITLNNDKYPCDHYNLMGEDCTDLLDEYFADYLAFAGEYGNYFIANSSGQLSFQLNDNNLLDNSGKFEIEIYKLTKDQHQYRNCFNRCPKKEPHMIDDYLARDHMEFLWKEKEKIASLAPELPATYIDETLEICWHGGYEDYRGFHAQVAGCQCIYNSNGDLVNTPSQEIGSYDYGYRFDSEDRRLHFILDVFPHIAYLLADPGFIYNAAPEENLY